MTGIGTATCVDQQPNKDNNPVGWWDFGDSSCEAIICSNPPTFANGYPFSSCVGDEIFKETCDLKCDQGYYMSGNGIATCEDATTAGDNAIGIWDTSGSSCKALTCTTNLMVFINGGPTCAGVKPFGGQCTLECNKGYYMTGIGTATCIDQQPNQDNTIGKWDFGDSSCEAVICSNPPTFANGYPSSSCVGDEIFKETCDLKCDQGYYMSGNGIATCEDATTADDNAIGIWDTSGSSCKEEKKLCPFPYALQLPENCYPLY
ncbi:E-selectin-like [Styela clava]